MNIVIDEADLSISPIFGDLCKKLRFGYISQIVYSFKASIDLRSSLILAINFLRCNKIFLSGLAGIKDLLCFVFHF